MKKYKSVYFIGLALYIIFYVQMSPSSSNSYNASWTAAKENWGDSCKFTLVESIPENLTYPAGSPMLMSTYDAHLRLLSLVQESLYFSTFYWTLRGSDVEFHDNSSVQGENIYKLIYNIVKSGKVDVKIAQNNTNSDTDELASIGAQVRTLDFVKIMNAGVLHTKMWIVDQKHVYIGSSNLDWRSYTQTKETGVLIENCPSLGLDVSKIFEVYWYLGNKNILPSQWPSNLSTAVNSQSPAVITYNQTKNALIYISSSPQPFCPFGRTVDIDAIINVINSAKKYIYISVMEYVPIILYKSPQIYWPVIDDALRRAAFDRNVEVFLMASHWAHSEKDMYSFLRSLRDLHGTKDRTVNIEVKLFTVKPNTPIQSHIPYARVNHNKYMITDQHAYIGTSNWAGDYFVSTGGVGFVLEEAEEGGTLKGQLLQVFLRDWHSVYAANVF
ncbi:5'-3' exonuclease PLD3-like [Biomphalaria glabrata]|uniref:5'-3' exonuclease PLD3-like n=1 Tax=Biomphalaria glabrata TaxID=6526 RepID=A0A9W2ZYM9_BIOGL|nr:5'-3' exonuclease PLD3-like [Biomphalaria glabrata]